MLKQSVYCDFFHDVFPGTSLINEGKYNCLYESLQDSYNDNDDSISNIGPVATAPPPVPPTSSDSEDACDDSSISSTSSSHPVP
jgi:hypothetical protein